MFRINTKVDYGVIVLRELAQNFGNEATSLRAIARKTRLPYRYLARVMATLVKTGIVQSREGIRGGYTLIRKPSTLTLQEIIKALEPTRRITRCAPHDHAVCKFRKSCPMAPWWFELNAELEKKMQTTTLDTLL